MIQIYVVEQCVYVMGVEGFVDYVLCFGVVYYVVCFGGCDVCCILVVVLQQQECVVDVLIDWGRVYYFDDVVYGFLFCFVCVGVDQVYCFIVDVFGVLFEFVGRMWVEVDVFDLL